ncbi:protein of unknown function [Candidatus Promineifilum breve]|uniref:Uncharacterized protein n=1 Tax=Candidatus Promineifilum breve TaxID=1806508 RepID=A0A170PHH0_9CHLR|nr:protein of unknown function [Candidatus Promineifilum breve]
MQRQGIGRAMLDQLRFSTLYRVEGCAATYYRQGNTTLMMFQYPLSGRRLCSTAATSPSPVP